MKRPVLTVRLGESWMRGEGWSLIVILAPWPADEQTEGRMVDALLNMEIYLCLNPFRFWIDGFSSDPADRPIRSKP